MTSLGGPPPSVGELAAVAQGVVDGDRSHDETRKVPEKGVAGEAGERGSETRSRESCAHRKATGVPASAKKKKKKRKKKAAGSASGGPTAAAAGDD